jgi:hypothetical protein
MEYNVTSVKQVLAKIVRDLDQKFSAHYMDSILEWIPEAMGELEYTHQLVTKSTPNYGKPGAIVTRQHVAALPCGMVYLRAVENERGFRVKRGTDETDITNPSTRYHTQRGGPEFDNARVTQFRVDPFDTTTGPGAIPNDGGTPWDGSDVKSDTTGQIIAYYKLQGGYIQTSQESMFVKLHYDAYPIDKDGYPLIPDLPEFRESLYWYVVYKMIGSGYQHPVLPRSMQGMEYAKNKFDQYAGQALNKMKLMDMDRAARLRDNFSLRLVPPYHFYEDFSVGGEQMQGIYNV